MGLPDTKAPRLPTLSEMAAVGMYDIQTRGTAIDPPPSNRGLQTSMKAQEWMTTITSFAADRPMIRAIRDTPEESDRDARLRFMAIFDKGQKLPPMMDHPDREAKRDAKPKPPAKPAVVEHDDIEDLI